MSGQPKPATPRERNNLLRMSGLYCRKVRLWSNASRMPYEIFRVYRQHPTRPKPCLFEMSVYDTVESWVNWIEYHTNK